MLSETEAPSSEDDDMVKFEAEHWHGRKSHLLASRLRQISSPLHVTAYGMTRVATGRVPRRVSLAEAFSDTFSPVPRCASLNC